MSLKKDTDFGGVSIGKITELRNEREIARATQYTEEELAAHLDPENSDATNSESKTLILSSLLKVVQNIGLGQTNKELSRVIDALLETVAELDHAAIDLVAGAEAQAHEFHTEIDELQEELRGLRTVSVAEIESELKRREEEKEKIIPVMDGLYKERESLEDGIQIQDQLLKHEASDDASATRSKKTGLERRLVVLNKTLEAIESGMIQNDQEEAILVAYRDAVKFVSGGLPEGIIGRKIGILA